MSIYISGLSLPQNGKYLHLRIDSEGTIDGEYTEDKYICTNFVEREEKAIELPPHGRLIDADKLMANIRAHDYLLTAMCNSQENGMFTCGIQQAVDETGTIIPADPAEGGADNG